ncbi:MAG: RNA-binding protein [Mariprofundales bacterium]
MLNIYVGNLPYSVNEDDLRNLFSEFGEVSNAHVISDRDTGRSKGFGFVEMENSDDGQKAIEALDGSDLQGRNVRVNEAKPREDNPRRRF